METTLIKGLESRLSDKNSTNKSHQAVLLPVVQPVARPSCADYSLKLVGFHPNDLVHSLVSAKGQIEAKMTTPGLMGARAEVEKLTPKD